MSRYTFHGLSPADFEELCADLLSASEGRRFQPFAAGPDEGIDLLHSSCDEKTVVQCKHYAKSGFAALERTMRNDELPKVLKLKPDRYVICTSVGLTPSNKRTLVGTMTPFCHGPEDVFGLDDLDQLLLNNREVEQRHHKLWLTSTAVLERILHAGAAAWKSIVEEEIERELRVYVQTAAHDEAMRVLNEHHICVLSGIPGIGKTTLAKVLVARFVDEDYELVVAQNHVREAMEGLRPDGRFVIYYDDFLGQSRFELGKNEDASLVGLFFRARQAGGSIKIILTTREYILREAHEESEKLHRSGIAGVTRVVVDVGSYTRGRRARILYNHLFFSDLDPAYISALVKERQYRKIIDHVNFSPRVIEWMTQRRGTEELAPDEFVKEFLRNLDNPVEIWKRVFEQKLSPDQRNLLYCVATFGSAVLIQALETTWQAREAGDAGEARLRFREALCQLDGSFLRVETFGGETGIELHNPSISDFLMARIAEDGTVARGLLEQAIYFEQVARLVSTVNRRPSDSGWITDGSVLADAIRRTFQVALPRRQSKSLEAGISSVTWRAKAPSVVGFVRHDGTAYWSTQTRTAGRRIEHCLEWTEWIDADAILTAAGAETYRLIQSGQLFGRDTPLFVGLLAALEQNGALREILPGKLTGDLLNAIRESLDESSEAMDWTEWGKFIASDPGSIDAAEREAWIHRVHSFLDEQTRHIVDDLDDSYVEDAECEVKQVAEAWGIDPEKWLDEIRNREEKGDLDDWVGVRVWEPSERTRGAFGDEDQDLTIDRLFRSLPESSD